MSKIGTTHDTVRMQRQEGRLCHSGPETRYRDDVDDIARLRSFHDDFLSFIFYQRVKPFLASSDTQDRNEI